MAKDDGTKKLLDEALGLLKDSPTRMAVEHHKYWPWKRRAEAFLAKLKD